MATSLVNNKYRITRRIGGGSFGEIFMGVGPSNEKVAIKFERHGSRCPQLRHEYKVYRELANCHGFCSVYHFGVHDSYNVMVMDLLGPSLEDLFNKCARRFSLKTVLQLADQILERVDTLHSRHLIHRDIKPANFVIGIGDQGSNVYCVDFGLSKRYRHPKSLQHIPHRDGRSLTGTPRYASINNHLGIEQSRRDDLESVGYVLIYFLKGSLPWQGLKAKNAQKKYRMILEKKQQVSIAQLVQGCPSQFAEFLAYTRSLKFDAKPDIPYIRKLFRDLYHSQGCASSGKLWDWDHLDTDYMTSGATGGSVGDAPLIGASDPRARPTTSAAVGGAVPGGMDLPQFGGMGQADAADYGDEEDVDVEDGGYYPVKLPKGDTRGSLPSASGKPHAPPQQQQLLSGQNWGFSRPAQDSQQSGGVFVNAGHSDPSSKRPHTATNNNNNISSSNNALTRSQPGVTSFSFNPSQQMQQISDSSYVRKAPGVGGGGGVPMDQDEDDAHVVAGARAMMRYRRTRTPTDGAPEVVGGPTYAETLPPQQSGRGTWTESSSGAGARAAGAGAPRAVYQNVVSASGQSKSSAGAGSVPHAPSSAPSSFQVQGIANVAGMYNQRVQKSAATSGTGPNVLPVSRGTSGSGLLVGAVGPGNDRPKSATAASAGTGGSGASAPRSTGQGGSSLPVSGGVSAAGSAGLSYGSIKNRFLSNAIGGVVGGGGSGGGGSSGAGSAAGSASNTNSSNVKPKSSGSKLFTLSR